MSADNDVVSLATPMFTISSVAVAIVNIAIAVAVIILQVFLLIL